MVGNELTILVVDDNDGCRDLFSLWLETDHDVWTAADGTEALDLLSARVDVVLLDREMPGPDGTSIAREIDAGEYDPHVVMVSSKKADFDIIEIPIDGYVQKPVDRRDLFEVLERYEAKQEYRQALDEFFALTAKVATLEAEKSSEELDANERYARLKWLVAEKRAEVDEALREAGTDWTQAFKTCAEESTPVA